jgi:hypothetical protein
MWQRHWQAKRNILMHKHLRHVDYFANPEKLAKNSMRIELQLSAVKLPERESVQEFQLYGRIAPPFSTCQTKHMCPKLTSISLTPLVT